MARRPPTRAEILARHPRFRAAVLADARFACTCRGERDEFRGRLDAYAQVVRLLFASDGFAGLVLYRAQARLQALGVPVLPRLAHRLAMAVAQVCIGDLVVIRPGVYLEHGQVVIGSVVVIRRGVVIGPWVTIGVRAGNWDGPKIGADVTIGAGAKLIGPVRVGDGARVGPNAVVVADVPAHATVTGIPARVLAN
jgi:serine O-acetyltransferase